MLTKLKSLFPKKSLAPADEGSAHKRQGDEHLKLARLDDAAECYRRAISVNPANVDACVGLGYVLSEQRQYREAGECLRRALSMNSENADAHYILGTIAASQSDHAGAIDHFTRALEVKPDFEFAHRDLFAASFNSGRIGVAKDALRRAISLYPESAEYQFYLGNVFRHEEDFENAVACYQKALALQPGSAESHKSMADVLSKQGQLARAAEAYQKAIWFEPDFVDAHIDLGSLMQTQGRFDQAASCYQRAIELKPEHAAVRISLGNVLQKLGRTDEAIVCYRRVVASEPKNAPAHQFLGNALVEQGAIQEAVACYEQVLRLDPENPVKHLISALSGRDSERAPSDYVEKLFDEYAHKFDSHLVEVLSYSVPAKLVDLLRPYSATRAKWIILDLGCGTGLSGAALAPHAEQLVGVDLSAKMLEKARDRSLYHRLEQLDLLTMMQREPPASYDVVFAADVFVYLGKLDELVDQARRLLRPEGLFAFSVESLEALNGAAAGLEDARDYKLNITARYAHSIAYLERMAAHNGFDVLSTTNTQSRLDKGKPVQGYLALWRRAGV